MLNIQPKCLNYGLQKKIVQEWRTTEWPADYPPSRLEFTLTAKKDATELRMVHSKVPADQADDYSQGWHDSYWDPMKEYFGRKNKKASR